MRRRTLGVTAILVVLMAAFGVGVYRGLAHFRKLDPATAGVAQDPRTTTAQLTLPGTVYLTQNGDLYALHGARFTLVIAHDSGGQWVQPFVLAGGDIVLVNRHDASSDLVRIHPDGTIVARLAVGSAAKRPDGSLEDNHWLFEPRVSPDGATLFFSHDQPKFGYLVDLAVWAMPLPLAGAVAPTAAPGRPSALPPGAKAWTTPNEYTGGDIDPQPLAGGGVIFTRYSIDGADKIHSQLWYVASPRDNGTALTDAGADCSGAAISPDGTQVAMVCTDGTQVSRLEVGTLAQAPVPTATAGRRATSSPAVAAPVLGGLRVLVDGTLVAQPVWAPDGSGLAYVAPAEAGGDFQLWWLAGAATGAPGAPVQVSSQLGFDATSRPAWVAAA